MRPVLMVIAVASLFVPALEAETNYKAKIDVETAFNKAFGATSLRTWAEDRETLLTLVGRTKPILRTDTLADDIEKSLEKYISIPVEHLRPDVDRTIKSAESKHYEFHQYIGDHAVENAKLYVDLNPADEIIAVTNQTIPDLQLAVPAPLLSLEAAKCFAAAAFLKLEVDCAASPELPDGAPHVQFLLSAQILFAVPPSARWAYAVELRCDNPYGARRYVIDATTSDGNVLETRDRVHYAATCHIFNPNPMTDPGVTSFNNVTFQTPPYEKDIPLVDLTPQTDGQVRLIGRYVQLDDFVVNAFFPDDGKLSSATGDFTAQRGTLKFASAMAYYHIDAQQQYIHDTLRLTNVANRPIKVDVRPGPSLFESKYTNDANGTGTLSFGYRDVQGQVFQAEDGDIIAHEYAHALQSASAKDRFDVGAKETLAMSEGFADYWALSYFEKANSDHALPRECYGDWSRRNNGATGCDRNIRLNATKNDFNPNGLDHDNAAVWTATLWKIREKLQREMADRLILKSHESVPDGPDFLAGAKAIFTADNSLHRGANHVDLCTIFEAQKIMKTTDCPPPNPGQSP